MGSRTRWRARALAAVLLAVGCRGGEGDVASGDIAALIESSRQPPRAIDAEQAATDPAMLLSALQIPHARVGALLGSHTWTAETSLRATQGETAVDELRDTTRIDFDGSGYHLVYENNHDDGREVFFVGGELYLRGRYGAFHRRLPRDEGEAAQIRNVVAASTADYFEVVAHAAVPHDDGAVERGGRPAQQVSLSVGTGKPPAQRLTHRKWREELEIRQLTGEVTVDLETGIPLAAAFQAIASYTVDGQARIMEIKARHEIAVTETGSVSFPEDFESVSTPHTGTEIEDRKKLLKGLAVPRAMPTEAPRVPKKKQRKARAP